MVSRKMTILTPLCLFYSFIGILPYEYCLKVFTLWLTPAPFGCVTSILNGVSLLRNFQCSISINWNPKLWSRSKVSYKKRM